MCDTGAFLSEALFFKLFYYIYIKFSHVKILDVLPEKVDNIAMRNATLALVFYHLGVFTIKSRFDRYKSVISLAVWLVEQIADI